MWIPWQGIGIISLATNVILFSKVLTRIIGASYQTEVSENTAKVLMFPDGGYQCNYWTAGGTVCNHPPKGPTPAAELPQSCLLAL